MYPDLLLIHPPSYLYFREEERNYGPISDVIPSTPIFDMYPIGFLSLASYLARKGYKVAIKNIAARMILSKRYDYKKALKKIDASVVGIDLHWLVHAHGAIETARILKQYHPNIKIFLGGLSSTIFYKEILSKYPWIDYVILGDTTEPVVEKLLDHVIDGKREIGEIENIAYRRNGVIKENGIRFVPKNLDEYWIDYEVIFKLLVSSGDPLSFSPYADFLRNPIGAVFTVKGCTYNCVACGGSRHTYKKYYGRSFLARKKPETLVKEVKAITDTLKIPVFVVGDLQLHGRRFIENYTNLLRDEGIDTPFIYEFFTPPPKEVVDKLAKTSPTVLFQISPETQDERIRKIFGRPYSNRSLETFISNAMKTDVERLDLYFMIGLPAQDYESSKSIYKYVERVIREHQTGKRLDAFVAPLAPFIDPGSLIYDDPGRYGYLLRASGVEDHIALVAGAKDWRGMLDYETIWMNRETLARATYTSARNLLELKIKIGLIPAEDGKKIIERMNASYNNMKENSLEKDTTVLDELYPAMSFLRNLKKKRFLPIILFSMIKNLLGI